MKLLRYFAAGLAALALCAQAQVTDRLNGVQTGLAIKAPVKAVAVSNITLSGEQTVNGVAVVDGDRVLVTAQTNSVDNGIYVADTSAWDRAADFDGNRDVAQGTLVVLYNANADGVLYQVTAANPIVIGTSAITFQLQDDPAITYSQTPAEIAAVVTPTNTTYDEGDVRRYGWSALNTGAQNATDLTAAASVWAQGGRHPRIPAGTYSLSQFSVPAGRGLIIEGEGPSVTKLVHSTSGSMFVLGADNIQLFTLRDLYLEPSASTTVLLDWSGDFEAYAFRLENVELHQGSSGNTSAIGMQIVGGSSAVNDQKHYFTIDGLKVFGLGTGIKIDGTTAAANDLDARGVQMQGTADDCILLDESSGNRIFASLENCGDGATAFNLNILGTTSGDNFFKGRLENTVVSSNLVLNVDANTDSNNVIISTLTATPSPAYPLAINGGIVLTQGVEFSGIERRMRNKQRMLGSSAAEIMFVTALETDTMGGRGRFGIEADGRIGWSNSSAPSAWDAELRYSATDTAVRVTGANFRTGILEITDGVTAPANKAGVALIYVDSADGDLKVKFSDGVVKTLATD